jgi:GntR family transcriptional regulator / MocR family aminotransferase
VSPRVTSGMMEGVKRPPDGLSPVVAVDRRLQTPIYRQVYDGYRAAILDARLKPGQRLPSTRVVAQELQISRIAAVTAFSQLVAEGYVVSQGSAGSYVSNELPDAPRPRGSESSTQGMRPPGARRLPKSRLGECGGPWLGLQGAFRTNQPAVEEFPAELWARLVARHARRMSPRHMLYGDDMGLRVLREALASYLGTVRSVACTADQIIVVTGSQQALTIAAQALLEPGDSVWVEDPGYGGAHDAFVLAGARIAGVPVDDDGLDVVTGVRRAPKARAAYVTPSHQYPLGMVMSAPRRLQLLEWARRGGAWLLEDDYDSEYRYDGQPLASLYGLDGDARVLYIGTFSKVLFPALRVGYLVVPRDLVPRLRRFREAIDVFPATLHQAVLADFIAEGHFARHLRRMRVVYAGRRRALEAALSRELPSMRVVGERAGMHLVLMLPRGSRDREIALRAARSGLSVVPLSTCYSDPPREPGLVLGYGSTRASEIPDAVRKLRSILAGRNDVKSRPQ